MRITKNQAVNIWIADTDVYLSKHENMTVYDVYNKYTGEKLGQIEPKEASDFLVLKCGEKENEN